MISMIWCEDLNHGIGIDNKLPWAIKEEMDHFRSTTLNQIIVCGGNTFLSFGSKPLKNRTNIVLSLDKDFKVPENVILYHDMNKLMDDYKDKHIYIIGGKSIYQAFLKYADELIISTLKKTYNCNMFMNLDLSNFKKVKTVKHNEFDVNYYSRLK